MKRLTEIDNLCDVGTVCDNCGERYFPNRALASSLLKRPLAKRYCDQKCSASAVHAAAVEKSAILMKELLTGVARDPESGLGKSEHHIMAKFYCVESPDRSRYTFRNLKHFVRTNEQLFDNIDVIWSDTKPWDCRASKGLATLFLAKESRQRETWKGWRAVWKKDRLGNLLWEKARA